MSWDHKHPAHRSAELSDATREFIWTRDEGVCQLRYRGVCTVVGEEIDHIQGIAELGRRYDHVDNLRLVCCACHKLRTQQQRWPVMGRRTPERHPGIRWDRIQDASQTQKRRPARGP